MLSDISMPHTEALIRVVGFASDVDSHTSSSCTLSPRLPSSLPESPLAKHFKSEWRPRLRVRTLSVGACNQRLTATEAQPLQLSHRRCNSLANVSTASVTISGGSERLSASARANCSKQATPPVAIPSASSSRSLQSSVGAWEQWEPVNWQGDSAAELHNHLPSKQHMLWDAVVGISSVGTQEQPSSNKALLQQALQHPNPPLHTSMLVDLFEMDC